MYVCMYVCTEREKECEKFPFLVDDDANQTSRLRNDLYCVEWDVKP